MRTHLAVREDSYAAEQKFSGSAGHNRGAIMNASDNSKHISWGLIFLLAVILVGTLVILAEVIF